MYRLISFIYRLLWFNYLIECLDGWSTWIRWHVPVILAVVIMMTRGHFKNHDDFIVTWHWSLEKSYNFRLVLPRIFSLRRLNNKVNKKLSCRRETARCSTFYKCLYVCKNRQNVTLQNVQWTVSSLHLSQYHCVSGYLGGRSSDSPSSHLI